MNDTLLAAYWQVWAIIGTAVVGALIATWGVLSQRAVSRRTMKLTHMSLVDMDQDMIAARKIFLQEASKSEGLTPWADPGKEHTKQCEAIRMVLNHFELISISIQFATIDYEFYKRYDRGTVIRYWYAAAPFIYSLRKQMGSNKVYHEFEELFHWFEESRAPKRGFWLKKVF